jgi:arginine/ornithine N-succinyltransferase beta subunit
MGPLLHFIRPFDPFDIQTLATLSAAYDKALASLPAEQQLVVREAMAIRILDLASGGQSAIDKLRDGALGRGGEVVGLSILAIAVRLDGKGACGGKWRVQV